MTEGEKIKRFNKKYNCEILRVVGPNFIIKKDQYVYQIKKEYISKCKWLPSSMIAESYLDYYNATYLVGTDLKAVKLDGDKILIQNNITGLECWKPKYCPSADQLKSMLSITSKTVQYLEEVKKRLGNHLDYSKVNISKRSDKICVKCPEHGDFYIKVDNILTGSQCGCPKCSYEFKQFGKKGFVTNCTKYQRTPLLYIALLKGDGEVFLKIGITSKTIKERFMHIPYLLVGYATFSGPADEVYDMEKYLHKKYGQYAYIPNLKFNGRFECFYTNDLDSLHTEILENCKKTLKLLKN